MLYMTICSCYENLLVATSNLHLVLTQQEWPPVVQRPTINK